MSTGHVNDGADTSKDPGPSVEEQARQSNLMFWELSQRREEEEIDGMADNEGDAGSSSGDDGEDETGAEDETTTDGGDHTDAGERTAGSEKTTDTSIRTDDGGKKRVAMKPRPLPTLSS